MKKYLSLTMVLVSLHAFSQDSTMNSLTKDMEGPNEKRPVKVFQSERLINANTTEIVEKGKMDFKVSHNFDDIVSNTVYGPHGGIKTFFGLDNSTDIRIGFHLGLTDRLNLNIARSKGGSPVTKVRTIQLYEVALKYQLLRQYENDRSHPIAVTIFFNNVISAMNSDYTAPRFPPVTGPTVDTSLNQPFTFKNLGERMSQVLQLIIAKKIGKVGVELIPTIVHQGYVPLEDEKTVFAIGAAIRLPISKSISIIVDYFHSFRSSASKDYFKQTDFSFNPPNDINKNNVAFNFYDPLGVGIEFLTGGHVFHLNFTNSTEILENRLIPYTVSSWGKGQFRWGFNISRKFSLWKEKKK